VPNFYHNSYTGSTQAADARKEDKTWHLPEFYSDNQDRQSSPEQSLQEQQNLEMAKLNRPQT